MNKIIILLALVLLPVLACSQNRIDSPITVEWDGESSFYEIAVQPTIGEIIILGETSDYEYTIDLKALNIYGLYAVLVRSVEYTDPDMVDYSDWCRSDTAEDVIMIDGEPFVFLIESKRSASKPTMLRIK